MKKAQYFINALRNDDYLTAANLTRYVQEKYQKLLKAGEILSADELIPLTIYELMHTDFNEKDVEKLNILFNYPRYSELRLEATAYSITSFSSAASMAIFLNSFKNDNPGQFELALAEASNSNLNSDASIIEQIKESTMAVLELCLAKEEVGAKPFIQSISKRLAIDNKLVIALDRQFEQRSNFLNQQNTIITAYELYLYEEIVKQKLINEEGFIVSNLSEDQEKLLLRFETIHNLKMSIINETAESEEIEKAIDLCRTNKPSAEAKQKTEGSFCQKIELFYCFLQSFGLFSRPKKKENDYLEDIKLSIDAYKQ